MNNKYNPYDSYYNCQILGLSGLEFCCRFWTEHISCPQQEKVRRLEPSTSSCAKRWMSTSVRHSMSGPSLWIR